MFSEAFFALERVAVTLEKAGFVTDMRTRGAWLCVWNEAEW